MAWQLRRWLPLKDCPKKMLERLACLEEKKPVHMVAPRMGTVVQGLLIKLPSNNAAKFRRKAHAQNRADRVCSPYVGLNAINTPIANASAVRFGVSWRCRTSNAFDRIVSSDIIGLVGLRM